MVSITLPESDREIDPGLEEQFAERVRRARRPGSAARHRARTEAYLPARQSLQRRTEIAASVSVDLGSGFHAAELIGQGNDTIRAAVRTQGRQPVPFFCECADVDCRQALWLSLEDYDQHTQTGESILADGHARPGRRAPFLSRAVGMLAAAPID